jgi:glyoxylase-like metal-dependent hydrolase (beta-lactamase superfamily II)
MKHDHEIVEGISIIGGPNISHAEDATAFIVQFGEELVMIDAGAGRSAPLLAKNIRNLGCDPAHISTLLLTHCHIDHIGGAHYFKKLAGCAIVAHELDAGPIEEGDPVRTAATWYGTDFPPLPVTRKLIYEEEILLFGKEELYCLHTPGHTPGSLAIYLDRGGVRVLFGQDIHGPFSKQFGSDISQWRRSMEKLLALDADVLCEGHFGIFSSKDRVREYIGRYLRQYA